MSTPPVGPAVTYARDGLGRTASRTDTTGTQTYGYDGATGDLTQAQTGTGPVTTVLRGLDGAVIGQATTGTTTIRAFRNPHQDITAWANNTTGTVTATTGYDPFGSTATSTGTTNPLTLGYQQSPTDTATGLIDMGFRSYNPTSGRFTAKDDRTGAGGTPTDLNRYTYAGSDPIDFYDPDGHSWCSAGSWLDQFTCGWNNADSYQPSNDGTIFGAISDSLTTTSIGINHLATAAAKCGGSLFNDQNNCHTAASTFSWNSIKTAAQQTWHQAKDCVVDGDRYACGQTIFNVANLAIGAKGAGDLVKGAANVLGRGALAIGRGAAVDGIDVIGGEAKLATTTDSGLPVEKPNPLTEPRPQATGGHTAVSDDSTVVASDGPVQAAPDGPTVVAPDDPVQAAPDNPNIRPDGGDVHVYRVEGPENERVRIKPEGGVLIRGADKPIFLNFGVRSRAESFLKTRLEQGFERTQIKSFQVRKEFLDWLRRNAVPESMARDFPDAPLAVDTTKALDQYMLRPAHIKMMFDYIVPGSGSVG